MTLNRELILTKEEIQVKRTPKELELWVEKKCNEFENNDEIEDQVLLHKGLFKQFYEEVRPLSLFVNKIYPSSSDILCIPSIDNKDYDAVIRDCTFSPPHELKVEFTYVTKGVVSTSAKECGHDEYLRMEYFIEHRHVNTFGSLTHSEDKNTGCKINVEDEMIDHIDLLQNTFSLIKSAAEKKSETRKPRKYGKQTHVLVIVFDDWQWFNSKDMVTLENFMKTEILVKPLNFKTVYILGSSGKTFLSFELSV